ncbi:hypothetical protein AB1Y20_001995 [Prymnesium parvum]|uniref:TLC domain-containing protein n=1 Tax=Prymnesium parvum TaxID=97485 RepID=A0AB34J869_PRYPA
MKDLFWFTRRRPSPPCAPAVPSALALTSLWRDPTIWTWAAGPMLLFLLVAAVLALLPTPLQQKPFFCARNLVSLAAFTSFAYSGLSHWNGTVINYEPSLFGFDEHGWVLCKKMTGFQFFDILVSMSVPSLRKAEHVGHHVLAAGCAICALTGPVFTKYAVYYFGLVEVSSVPLCFVDVYRTVPQLAKGSKLHFVTNEIARTVFALTFIGLRVVHWPYVTWVMLNEMYIAWSKDDLRGFHFQFAYLLVVLLALSLLQQYWGYKVLKALWKMIIGDMGNREKEA